MSKIFTEQDAMDNLEADRDTAVMLAGCTIEMCRDWALETCHVLSITTGERWMLARDFLPGVVIHRAQTLITSGARMSSFDAEV